MRVVEVVRPSCCKTTGKSLRALEIARPHPVNDLTVCYESLQGKMSPPPSQHGALHHHRSQLLGVRRERISVEDYEIGSVANCQSDAPIGGRSSPGDFMRDALLRVPSWEMLVACTGAADGDGDGIPSASSAEECQRVETKKRKSSHSRVNRSNRSVGSHAKLDARLDERAEWEAPSSSASPKLLAKLPIIHHVHRLNRSDESEAFEERDIGVVEELRMLNGRTGERRRREGGEGLKREGVGLVADGVDGELETSIDSCTKHIGELGSFVGEDAEIGRVSGVGVVAAGRLRAERAIGDDLVGADRDETLSVGHRIARPKTESCRVGQVRIVHATETITHPSRSSSS